MYWALFTQIDSSWTFQSSQLNTTVVGYKIEADQAKAVGALLLLILIPVWQNIVLPTLLMFNIRISPLQCMTMGGLSAAMSFFCAAVLQLNIEKRMQSNDCELLSILWQFPQFLLIMLAEVWLSMTGLNFSFTQSPPSMRSVMTAAWFCNNAFGNLIVVTITELDIFNQQSNAYFFYTFLMFIAIFGFCWLAVNYRYTDYDEFIEKSANLEKRRLSSSPYAAVSSQDGLDLIF